MPMVSLALCFLGEARILNGPAKLMAVTEKALSLRTL